MPDVNKIRIANTIYNLKDSRVPELSSSTTDFLRGNGTWGHPTTNVLDNGDHLLFGPSSNWKLLASQEFSRTSTSTTNTRLGYMQLGADAYSRSKIICATVHDIAGPRNGYFYGCVAFLVNFNAINGLTTSMTTYPKLIFKYADDKFTLSTTSNTTSYGVYPYTLESTGRISIYSRYNSNYSTKIDGTYLVQIYASDFPNNLSIFDLNMEEV